MTSLEKPFFVSHRLWSDGNVRISPTPKRLHLPLRAERAHRALAPAGVRQPTQDPQHHPGGPVLSVPPGGALLRRSETGPRGKRYHDRGHTDYWPLHTTVKTSSGAFNDQGFAQSHLTLYFIFTLGRTFCRRRCSTVFSMFFFLIILQWFIPAILVLAWNFWHTFEFFRAAGKYAATM